MESRNFPSLPSKVVLNKDMTNLYSDVILPSLIKKRYSLKFYTQFLSNKTASTATQTK